jgi:lysyl-tRNA synthetase class 2
LNRNAKPPPSSCTRQNASPAVQSFLDPTPSNASRRAELFIHGREIVNTYEEENSPFEQRRKFVEQARWRDAENEARVDESYLEALEWVCHRRAAGVWDRSVVYAFAGSERIADVLSFGSLRNVVALK